jgi:hypothetical protein
MFSGWIRNEKQMEYIHCDLFGAVTHAVVAQDGWWRDGCGWLCLV